MKGCRSIFGRLTGTAGIACIAAMVVLLPGAAASASAAQVQYKTERLSAQEVHERCLDLAPGQQLSYSFVASHPLAFTIHYREGERQVYLAKKKVSTGKGTFTPRTAGSYCLTWNNHDAHSQVVRYRLVVHDAKQPRASKK